MSADTQHAWEFVQHPPLEVDGELRYRPGLFFMLVPLSPASADLAAARASVATSPLSQGAPALTAAPDPADLSS